MKKLNLILLTANMIWMISCSGADELDTTYQDLIDQGWLFFDNAQYDSALSRFTSARDYNIEPSDAYTARGWCFMKLDNLSSAASEFTIASSALDPAAELYAGWAFTLNAQKNYASSNTQASEALLAAPNWIFPHALNLNADHLHLLKAENYFALGDYANSLLEVNTLTSFSVDVSSSAGQAALAAKIEQLKTTL
ncbi:hypothetical protein JNM05_04720 [bacterium]|nr:hypothetical protein [bacterium]